MFRQLIFVLAIAGTASQAQQSPVPAPKNCLTAPAGHGFALRPPPKAAEYSVIKSQEWPDKSLGVMKRYQAQDYFQVDVFIYPAPSGCDAAVSDSLVASQARKFVEDIPRYKDRGYFEEATVRAAKVLLPTERDQWLAGRYVSLAVMRKGQPEYEEYLLFYLDGVFVKFRVSIKQDPALLERVFDFPSWYIPLLMATKVEDKQ